MFFTHYVFLIKTLIRGILSGGDFVLDSSGVVAIVSDSWLREPGLERFFPLSCMNEYLRQWWISNVHSFCAV